MNEVGIWCRLNVQSERTRYFADHELAHFASTLFGGMITFSAILFTQTIELIKRKRTHRTLMQALLQALREEVETKQDYFTVYHANAALVMQIEDADLRHSIFSTYTRAKGLLDMVSVNRLYPGA